MPSFVRGLFKWALAFAGNRSGLCIFMEEKLVGLGCVLDVWLVKPSQVFLCGAVPLTFPGPSAPRQGHPCPTAHGHGEMFAVPPMVIPRLHN